MLLPSDLTKSDRLQPWRRLVTAKAVGAVSNGEYEGSVIKRLWGHDARAVDAIEKAAVSVTTTPTASGLVEPLVFAYLRSLRRRSAAAQLFATPLPLARGSQIGVPGATAGWSEPTFVAEGGPIPASLGAFASVTVGPTSKLAMITSISGELSRYSAESAELIVSDMMDDAAARALDAAVFSTAAASAVRPAGLLNGVTAITATSGGGIAALTTDIKALVGAIVTAGGGSSILIFAHPVQAVAINTLAANGVGYPVIPAPSVAAGTVIAIEQDAIVSVFPELPKVATSSDAVIHFETNPSQLSATGTPNAVAAPALSAFQHEILVFRMMMDCTWKSRGAGLVQYLTGATW